ncbi:MAG: RHS repeat-associated core domain-containing protein, partial [Chloroflexi bacterium]|nr:RHS repeat-associated core domain-containing protein [Chloroflexota bacterium]
WMREDGMRIDRLLLVTDTTYIPTGEGPAASPIQVISDTVAPGITSHMIQYEYDPLYRLTEATYTGDIAATYLYSYDPVGNMRAYTETVDAQTTRVIRYFDDANRLQTSTDVEVGTTSYLYDNNGNLTQIIPPNGAEWLHYGFDQRNLMISHIVSISGTNHQPMATFVYDGNGDRIQQTDSSGSEPVTTTYINDVVGLTQVLVADDGNTQIHNLFGLDLLSQDEGTTIRYMLADGLGSVRTELVDSTVESVTTYDPYGNLLQQTGDSGTTYGYTGEQQDSSTGLLYLRARYYNPTLRTFMGRDPWSGNGKRPQSINGWSYVENNPVNWTDPTGNIPEQCKQVTWSKWTYVTCVANAHDVDYDYFKLYRYTYGGSSGDELFDQVMNKIQKNGKGCYSGPIPYRAPGYVEGVSGSGALYIGATGGREVVYDFATFQRANFEYKGGILSDSIGVSYAESVGIIKGFKSWRNIELDYSDWFLVGSIGAGTNLFLDIGVSIGRAWFAGIPDPSVRGTALYVAASFGGADAIPILEPAVSVTRYERTGVVEDYIFGNKVNVGLLFDHIRQGFNSPWTISAPAGIGYISEEVNFKYWFDTWANINKYKLVYEDVNQP